jgi:hypothetical protein
LVERKGSGTKRKGEQANSDTANDDSLYKSSKVSGTKRQREQANSDTANDGRGSVGDSKGSTKANSRVGERGGGKKETTGTKIVADSSDEEAGKEKETKRQHIYESSQDSFPAKGTLSDNEKIADSSDEEAGKKKETTRTRAQQQQYGLGTLQATSGTQDTSGEGDAINLSKHNKDRDAATGDISDNGRSDTMSPTTPAEPAVADPTATTTSAPTSTTTTTSANTTTPNPSENIKSLKGKNKDHESPSGATGDNSDNGRSGTMSPTTPAEPAVADSTATTTSASTTTTTTTSANTTTPNPSEALGTLQAKSGTQDTSGEGDAINLSKHNENQLDLENANVLLNLLSGEGMCPTTPEGAAAAGPTTTTTSAPTTTTTTTTSANTTTNNNITTTNVQQQSSRSSSFREESKEGNDLGVLNHGEESEIEVTSKALLKHYHTMSQVPNETNEIIEMILTSSNRAQLQSVCWMHLFLN